MFTRKQTVRFEDILSPCSNTSKRIEVTRGSMMKRFDEKFFFSRKCQMNEVESHFQSSRAVQGSHKILNFPLKILNFPSKILF